MMIYICLPHKEYLEANNEESIKNLTVLLNNYFSDFSLSLIYKKNASLISVFAMPKMMEGTNAKELKDKLAFAFDVNAEKIDLKTDYARINPNFKLENKEPEHEKSEEFDYEKLSHNYVASKPNYTFDQVILSDKTLDAINEAIGTFEVREKVFNEWGLKNIIPHVSIALNFYGAPGTGKTMTAEAVANKLGKNIIKATYADVESKYVGEGPKMIKAIFMAAERQNAVLFLDESDSLLSKRLINVSQGSEQAINSLRSQLLICLENFNGIVIFASNLVINYDPAFLSRLINIEFVVPSNEQREKIWLNHLKTNTINVPLSEDVDIKQLANEYEFCGREIKNAVKKACIKAALNKQDKVFQKDFTKACEEIRNENQNLKNALGKANPKD